MVWSIFEFVHVIVLVFVPTSWAQFHGIRRQISSGLKICDVTGSSSRLDAGGCNCNRKCDM